MEESDKSRTNRRTFGYYVSEVKRQWLVSLPSFLLPGIGSIFVFYVPALFVAEALSKLEAGNLLASEAIRLVLLFAGAWLLGEMLWRIAIHTAIKLQVRGQKQLFNWAMQQMFKKEMAFYADNFAGSLTKKILAFGRNFEGVTDVFAFEVMPNAIPLIFITVVLWLISPYLVLALYTLLVIFVLIIVPLIRRRQKLVIAREKASNILSGRVADIFTNMETIKTFAAEKRELKTYQQVVDDFSDKAGKSWDYQNRKIDLVISPLYVGINAIGLAIAIWASMRGLGSASGVFITFTYFAKFTTYMWEFNRTYRQLETFLSDAGQFTALLEHEPRVKDQPRPQKLTIKDGEICFKNVHFTYQIGSKKVLADFDLTIPAGQKVGLVGHSGGGKTTLTKLLLRFSDLDSGSITIDGQDISKISQADLRRSIAYVPQEPILFHRSLAHNIAYGKPKATAAEIKRAAELAHADKFINSLPEGYETLVGERGMKLSGGQKQRVAIARAMLINAPVLLLDEATSALDSKSEKLIRDGLDNLMKNRTTLVIAHRLSTIRKMDRIIVMKDGVIVEDGTHEDLLKAGGEYAELWEHQSGDFL